MYSHEPENYDCPFCKIVSGLDTDINSPEFIVYQDDLTIAFVAPKWWEHNPGHVLVIPKDHCENIYTIPEDVLAAVYKTAKKMAVAIKESYNCEGISTRQHNEPAGNQDVWHLHVHVFPRYENDDLYKNDDNASWFSRDERLVYVKKLKDFLSSL